MTVFMTNRRGSIAVLMGGCLIRQPCWLCCPNSTPVKGQHDLPVPYRRGPEARPRAGQVRIMALFLAALKPSEPISVES